MAILDLLSTKPLRSTLQHSARRRAEGFRSATAHDIQRGIFRKLLTTAASTRFGKDHDFHRLAALPFEQAYAAYREQVPVRTYQDFWNDYFIEGWRSTSSGDVIELHDLTWPGRIKLLCETSGTTAPTKFIPFSGQMFAANRRAALDLMACYLAANPGSRLPGGKILYMSGSTDLNLRGRGIYSGDMSAITLRFRPWYLTPFIAPPGRVTSLPWDDRLQAMAELLLSDTRIRCLSGVPPWIVLLLRRCRELSGKEPAEALPHLELIIHGGTSIRPYRAEFEELFNGRLPNLLEVLPSSEAFMGFQCGADAGMRLTPFYGAFFEFIRFDDLDQSGRPAPHARAIPLEQVETGQRYAVILSTCAGLWRYHIGDTIRFTGTNPHFIEFTGRDRFLDKLEEKVTQEEVERVVSELNSSGSYAVREFMVGCDVPGRRHVWFLAGTGCRDATELTRTLDDGLQKLNADYATFRKQARISSPQVMLLPPDLIYDWSRQVRNRLGGQSKIPHIDPSPDGFLTASLLEFYQNTPPR